MATLGASIGRRITTLSNLVASGCWRGALLPFAGSARELLSGWRPTPDVWSEPTPVRAELVVSAFSGASGPRRHRY
jgi:hypothetical protein